MATLTSVQSAPVIELLPGPLTWTKCYTDLKCATLEVPVDYTDPTLGTFGIKVLKYPSKNPTKRLGSIVVNPGGPGGSGIDFAYNAEFVFGPDLLDRYDIIGFDPRGVGSSDPIRCYTDKESDYYLSAPSTPDTVTNQAFILKTAKNFAEKCAKAAGNKLGHYSSVEVVKDMESLRVAMGEEKLNYVGKSYGTYLGALFLAAYPQSVGRFVLDGAINPNITVRQQNLDQAIGFDMALKQFLKQTGISPSIVRSIFKSSAKQPLRSKSGRKVTQSLVITGFADALYDNINGWPRLDDAIVAAQNGDGSLILDLADEYNGRDPNGNFVNNENDISQMVECLDFKDARTVSQFKKDIPVFRKTAPYFGEFLSFSGIPCKFWKAPPVLPTAPVKNVKTPPVMVIGVTRDPATPYAWAQALTKQLSGAKLVTLVGDGHTGQGRGYPCIDTAVERYLISGQLPKKALVCKPE